MDQLPNVYSRKSISNWLKNIPYSQNLNDGVLFCKVLQQTDSFFPKFIETPRTQYQNLKNFRVIQKYLQKQNLYRIDDVSKFAVSKDFFEFSSWLYSHYSKKMSVFQPLSESALTLNKSGDFGNTSRIQLKEREKQKEKEKGKQNVNVKENLKLSMEKDKPVDFFEVFQNDIKNLLVLTARKDDIEYLEKMIKDMEVIIEKGESVEDVKENLKKRFYGNLAHLL